MNPESRSCVRHLTADGTILKNPELFEFLDIRTYCDNFLSTYLPEVIFYVTV